MIAVALFTTATYAQSWTSEISSIKDEEMGDYALAAMDKDGNLYVTGVQDKNFKFAGKEAQVLGIGSYIAKYNVNGVELFAITLQGAVEITAITTDANNNLYVAGSYEDVAYITDVEGVDGDYKEIGSEEATGAFIAKYDANGNLLTVKTYQAEHNALIKEMNDYGLYWGSPAEVEISKMVAEGSRVYVQFDYIGDVAVDNITLNANYKFVYDMAYMEASNVTVVSFDSTLANAVNEANVTVAEACADASSVNSFNFTVEDEDVYVAVYGMGNLVLTTSAGSEAFNFQTTDDFSGNVEMGAIVAIAGKKAVKFSNELYAGYGENLIAGIDVVNGKICLAGTFEGSCAFDYSKVAKGSVDLFATSIDANEFTADWVYTSADSENKTEETVSGVIFGKENICVVSLVETELDDENSVYDFRNYAISYNGDVKRNSPIEATTVAYNENNVAFVMATSTVKVAMYDAEIIASSIEAVNAEAENNVIYDLAGRRVEKITEAGIYIVNGKKALVK